MSAQPPELHVVPLVDQETERHGFYPRELYIEAAYLPLMGPTATFLYRRLGTLAGANPDGINVDMIDLSKSLGLGDRVGPSSRLTTSIGRLVAFRAAEWQDTNLAVRRALPALSDKAVEKISQSSQTVHWQLAYREVPS